jgi:hypothetical protein
MDRRICFLPGPIGVCWRKNMTASTTETAVRHGDNEKDASWQTTRLSTPPAQARMSPPSRAHKSPPLADFLSPSPFPIHRTPQSTFYPSSSKIIPMPPPSVLFAIIMTFTCQILLPMFLLLTILFAPIFVIGAGYGPWEDGETATTTIMLSEPPSTTVAKTNTHTTMTTIQAAAPTFVTAVISSNRHTFDLGEPSSTSILTNHPTSFQGPPLLKSIPTGHPTIFQGPLSPKKSGIIDGRPPTFDLGQPTARSPPSIHTTPALASICPDWQACSGTCDFRQWPDLEWWYWTRYCWCKIQIEACVDGTGGYGNPWIKG